MFRFFQGVQLAELVESPKFAAHTQRVVSALDQTLLALNRPSDFVYMIKGKYVFLLLELLRKTPGMYKKGEVFAPNPLTILDFLRLFS